LRQTEAKVSETEAHIATTLRTLAAAARATGRTEDAGRLDREANLADEGAAEARRQSLSTAPSRVPDERAVNS
jgi:hypothetical protein